MAAGWDWRILATDISTKALAKAKAGIYAMDRIEQVSTGGKEALNTVLTKLPADMPPIVILQHIQAYFSKAFADRLHGLCQLEVREAVQGDRLRPGLALVAPGGFHMVMQWSGSGYGVRLN
jgi:two-component system chemotaxis response regulator CheB